MWATEQKLLAPVELGVLERVVSRGMRVKVVQL
jgi:hypothetical protein